MEKEKFLFKLIGKLLYGIAIEICYIFIAIKKKNSQWMIDYILGETKKIYRIHNKANNFIFQILIINILMILKKNNKKYYVNYIDQIF